MVSANVIGIELEVDQKYTENIKIDTRVRELAEISNMLNVRLQGIEYMGSMNIMTYNVKDNIINVAVAYDNASCMERTANKIAIYMSELIITNMFGYNETDKIGIILKVKSIETSRQKIRNEVAKLMVQDNHPLRYQIYSTPVIKMLGLWWGSKHNEFYSTNR